jgi:hypothetical protein
MERITMEQVETRARNVNTRLVNRGSSYRVSVEGRNGYIALDEIRASDGATINTIRTGTKREIADGLWWMMRGIDYATTYTPRG